MRRLGLLLLAFGWLGVSGAAAQEWRPERPIRLVVGFAPGIATDLVARVVAPGLSERLGRPVVVENRGGAGGVIGADAVAKAAPDGHTLGLLAAAQLAVNAHLMRLPYDPLADFTPIAGVVDLPSGIVVHASVPARTLPELAAWLRGAGAGATCSGGTAGAMPHLAMALLQRSWGTACPLMMARAGAPAAADLISGQLAVGAPNIAAVLGPLQAGRLRLLAVTTTTRLPAWADVPTVAESVPGFEAVSWNMLFGPARLPPPMQQRIAAVMAEVLADPPVAARLAELTAIPRPLPPEAVEARVRVEHERWGSVVREAGIRLE